MIRCGVAFIDSEEWQGEAVTLSVATVRRTDRSKRCAFQSHFPERKGFTLRFELQKMNVDLGNQLANVPPHLPRHGSSLSRRVSLRIEGSMEFQPD